MWENRIWDGITDASALKLILLNLRRSIIHQNKYVVMQYQIKEKTFKTLRFIFAILLKRGGGGCSLALRGFDYLIKENFTI